jgi:PAS domain S-box-containing protein
LRDEIERRNGVTTPYKILIIEDEPDDVELILLGFSKHDEFFVDVATTGEEGLERVATNHYDLVSVDFALPGISGLDVLEEIRKSDQDVPVVMVTGRGTEELQVVAFEKFATSYVMKSVDSFRSLPTVFEALINESRYRSQERRMKREIERSETVSRYILENSPMGIYVLQNGSFKMANSKFAEIFGCDKEKLIGEPFWSLAEPASFECEDEEAEEPRHPRGEGDPKRPIVHEFGVTRKDGSKRWVEVRIALLDDLEERYVLGNVVDATDRKKGERDLMMLNRRLAILHNLILKAIDFRGEADDLVREALVEAMAGPDGFEVGGVFHLDEGRLVLRGMAGPLEALMEFAEKVDVEELLEGGGKVTVVGRSRPLSWGSTPYSVGGGRKGLLVLGREEKIGDDLLKFMMELAWHFGKMEEAFERLRAS